MNRLDVVKTWVNRWRHLRAWGRSLELVDVTVSEREHPRRAGTCWTREQRITLYHQDRLTDVLTTALHEYAHAVEITAHHGLAWQARYAAAVGEVTGIVIPGGIDGDYKIIDCAARDAVRAWWHRSGNAMAMKLLKIA